MKQSHKTLLTIILPTILVIGGLIALSKTSGSSSGSDGKDYTAFAQCLTEKGATLYATYWCPHCLDQKKLFGSAISEVNAVECALPGGSSAGQTQICKDKDIQSYPTWEFADGSRESGVQTLEALAEKTGCELPALEG